MNANRQTHTDTLITILRSPIEGGVITSSDARYSVYFAVGEEMPPPLKNDVPLGNPDPWFLGPHESTSQTAFQLHWFSRVKIAVYAVHACDQHSPDCLPTLLSISIFISCFLFFHFLSF